MGTDVLEFIYLVCFFLGLGFAVLSALLAGVFGGHAGPHVDTGGVHVDLGASHTDGTHGVATDGQVHFTPLSPVSIALFVTTFGGVGLLFKKFGFAPFVQLPVAAVSGMIVGGAVAYAFFRLTLMTQASSHARAGEEIGLEAEITVSIPNNGLGEIAYIVRGTRFTNPARTVDGKELPAHVMVRIVQQTGNTYVVQKA
jgi:membrane protein implicated in regulation of membrane protease activity